GLLGLFQNAGGGSDDFLATLALGCLARTLGSCVEVLEILVVELEIQGDRHDEVPWNGTVANRQTRRLGVARQLRLHGRPAQSAGSRAHKIGDSPEPKAVNRRTPSHFRPRSTSGKSPTERLQRWKSGPNGSGGSTVAGQPGPTL